jgi:hypothetical protein
MNAQVVQVSGGSYVLAQPTGFNLAFPNVVIKIEGAFSDSIAKGILRMLNEDQCVNCGKFNGLHGEVFHVTDMSGGEVNGKYRMCPLGEK